MKQSYILLLIFPFLSLGCQLNKKISDDKFQDMTATDQSRKPQKEKLTNYISLEIKNYSPYQQILKNLDKILGNNEKNELKNRGEAHITVITPPEFAILTTQIKAEVIHLEWNKWTEKSFKELCLGEGQIVDQNSKLLKTYFIVVDSPDLKKFRNYLKQKYSIVNFNADLFYPHITIGFTDHDLHYEQGVIKNASACRSELQKVLFQ